jgi:L-aminopeptidase/D-esterase-like protein
VTPGRWGSVTDVPGVRVGSATLTGDGRLTGVTVVLPPAGTVGAVDVRGGGPGTHETDALDPTTLVPTVDAVVLTGGSAYGLASAAGVQAWLEEQGRGYQAGPAGVVPIVPAAAVFDLGRGGSTGPATRPDAALGRAAVLRATTDPAERGVVGAGTGALAAFGRLKGGVGSAALPVPAVDGLVVGALAVVNAAGSPADAVTGALLGRAFVPRGLARPEPPTAAGAARLAELLAAPPGPPAPSGPAGPRGSSAPPGPDAGAASGGGNTTLVVVATNGALDPAQARRTAMAGHGGIARALDPSHTLVDGDTVFVLATGQVQVPPEALLLLQAAAASAVTLAVLDGLLAATATRTPAIDVPSYADLAYAP